MSYNEVARLDFCPILDQAARIPRSQQLGFVLELFKSEHLLLTFVAVGYLDSNPCPLLQLCTHRQQDFCVLTLLPQAQHLALPQARWRQTTDDFKTAHRARARRSGYHISGSSHQRHSSCPLPWLVQNTFTEYRYCFRSRLETLRRLALGKAFC